MVVLGLTEEQFWDSDPCTLAGCFRVKQQVEEKQQQDSWERTRWQTAVLLAPHNRGKMIEPQQLIVFPWEKSNRKQTKPEDYPRIVEKLGSKIKPKNERQG